jgi:hypothetical protein
MAMLFPYFVGDFVTAKLALELVTSSEVNGTNFAVIL